MERIILTVVNTKMSKRKEAAKKAAATRKRRKSRADAKRKKQVDKVFSAFDADEFFRNIGMK